MNKAQIRNQYENQNSQIDNAGQQYNIGNRYNTDNINAANKANALSNYYNQLDQLGRNTANGMTNYRADKYDKQGFDALASTYNNPEYRKSLIAMGYKFDPRTGEKIG